MTALLSQSKVVGGTTSPDIPLTENQKLAIGAFLKSDGLPKCTGTLIDSHIVLTAAHCRISKGSKFVIGFDAEDPAAKTEVLAVASHPQYTRTPKHDLSLVYLADDLPCDKIAIGVPPDAGEEVQCAGFGWTEAVRTNKNTERWWVLEPIMTKSSLYFVVNGQGYHGLCNGDSGGPALCLTSQGPTVVGTLSMGDASCTGSDTFAVPMADADWIASTISAWKANPPKKTALKAGVPLVLGVLALGVFIHTIRN